MKKSNNYQKDPILSWIQILLGPCKLEPDWSDKRRLRARLWGLGARGKTHFLLYKRAQCARKRTAGASWRGRNDRSWASRPLRNLDNTDAHTFIPAFKSWMKVCLQLPSFTVSVFGLNGSKKTTQTNKKHQMHKRLSAATRILIFLPSENKAKIYNNM